MEKVSCDSGPGPGPGAHQLQLSEVTGSAELFFGFPCIHLRSRC